MRQWWITDGPLPEGNKIWGPSGSFADAQGERSRIEKDCAPDTFWIDSEDG